MLIVTGFIVTDGRRVTDGRVLGLGRDGVVGLG